MGKANKAAKRAANAIAAANANPHVLVGMPGKPVTHASLWAFINAHGGPTNVTIKPLPNVVMANGVAGIGAIPFGYNGKPTGVRTLLQGYILNGVKGNRTYHAVITACRGHNSGHSYKNPTCLYALLNGGYSPSAATYGTAYVQLVGNAPKVKATPTAKATAPTATVSPNSGGAGVTVAPLPAPVAATGTGNGNS